MPDLFIDAAHFEGDDDDLSTLVQVLADLGYRAEPSHEGRVTESVEPSWWVLTLRWMGDDTLRVVFDAVLAAAGAWAVARFQRRRPHRQPPRRIDLYGPDGNTVIASVDVPDDDDGDSDIAVPGQAP